MPSPDVAPRSLDAWLQELEAVRLPISPGEQLFLQRTLGDDHLSLREVATRVQTSPIFVLALIREASLGLAEPVATAELALRRLGLSRAAGLLREQHVQPEENIPAPLRQVQLVCLHAMQQADGLFGVPLARLAGEIQLASLLFLAPLWPLAQAYPTLLAHWARRVVLDREPAAKVEQALFGVPLRSLCLALAERWRLPEWVELGYRLLGRDRRRLVQALHIAHDDLHPLHQQQMLDEHPALRRWLTQPANTILLANGIAIAAHSDWNDLHSLRWQRLVGLYLNLPLDAVQRQAHQQAVVSARLHARPGLWHPAQMLVWQQPTDCGPSRRASSAVVPEPDRPQGDRDQQAWLRHCLRLRQPGSFRNAVELLDCARDALAACGLPRLLLLVANRDHSQLLIRQSHGLHPAPAHTAINCLDDGILPRLLHKPARLLLDADSFSRLAGRLPSPLPACFTRPPLLLQSLASGARVRLLLVAEWPVNGADAPSRDAVEQTLRCIEQAIGQMTGTAGGA